MKDKKNIPLLVAGIILLIAVVVYFTVFNKNDIKDGPGGTEKDGEKFDVNNLYNMVPYVQRANYGLYTYGSIEINVRGTEDLVIGALNHYEYINCNGEKNAGNCDTIEADKIIDEVKNIYGVSITKDDMKEVKEYYVFGDGVLFKSYTYKDDVFTAEGIKGFLNKNNPILKKEEKDNEYLIYEKIYYLSIDYKDGDLYEVLYEGNDYSKEITREKLTEDENGKTGGVDLSKYGSYGVTYIHTFKKDDNGNYQYFSSNLETFENLNQ